MLVSILPLLFYIDITLVSYLSLLHLPSQLVRLYRNNTMDPVAAIAFLCNVFDLAERTIKCVKIAKETYDSASGLPRQYETLSEFTMEMTAISVEVQRSHKSLEMLGPVSRDADSPLKSVALSRQEISLKITAIFEKCRSKKERSMGGSVKATLRHLFAKNELEILQGELESNH